MQEYVPGGACVTPTVRGLGQWAHFRQTHCNHRALAARRECTYQSREERAAKDARVVAVVSPVSSARSSPVTASGAR